MHSVAAAPVRQIILKLHSRCNLACSYCYVYEHADQSWRRQPFTMSPETIALAAARIGEHARRHSLGAVTVILHGGEPLLAGAAAIELAARAVRGAVPGGTSVDVRLQTNGLLLDDPMLEVLRRNEIYVGVSLDGDATANDRHRRFAHGGGSHAGVARGVRRLRQPRFRHLFSGLLCTVDVRNDPLAVYEGLLAFDPPRIDFLLPHGNWTTPPPERVPGSPATPYADWLITVFDRWYGAPRRETDVRLFSSILALLLGGASATESVGLAPSDLVVVETDGSIEQGDALKTTQEGMSATGLRVADNSFDEALGHAGIRARQLGLAALAPKCRRCDIVSVCGGGLYAHRFRAANGFANPTVYCPDQLKLIQHLRVRLEADVRGLEAPAPPGPPPRYGWTAEQFRHLGSGYGDPAAVAVLRSAQSSKRRLLLSAVGEVGPRSRRWIDDGLDPAWELLVAGLREPDERTEEVISHPFVDAWSQSCLRELRTDPGSPAADLAYLGGLAVAVAIRAGLPFELRVATRAGQVWLPTLGLGYDLGAASAVVASDGDGLVIRGGDRMLRLAPPYTEDVDGWLAQRRMTGESPSGRLTVAVEDLDPYRSCFGLPVAPRMAAEDRGRLARQFAEAWSLIGTHHPRHAAAMRGGLRSIVPLLAPPRGSQSAAAQSAFGAIAVSPTVDAAELALLMIHEAQHMKLGAIFDVIDLYEPADTGRHHAPWRADPRPVGALFQGAYAHLGVADFWRVQRGLVSGAAESEANFEFAYWLEQTRRATDALARSGGLTAAGVRFVAYMAATLDGWRHEPLDPAVASGARDVVHALSVQWRLTNTRPATGDADRLAAAFRAGGPAPSVAASVAVSGTPAGPARLDGLAHRLRGRLRGGAGHAGVGTTVEAAEDAYLAGDFGAAAAGYSAALHAAPDNHRAWSGLALALGGAGSSAAAALLARPDLIRDVYALVRDDARRPSPESLVRWFAGQA